jgi:hypothetical protein
MENQTPPSTPTPPTTPHIGTPLAASPQSLLEAKAYNDTIQTVVAMAALSMSSPQKSKVTSASDGKMTFKANRACWSPFVGSGGGHAKTFKFNFDGVNASYSPLNDPKTPKAIKRGRYESSSPQSESPSPKSESPSPQSDGGGKFRK